MISKDKLGKQPSKVCKEFNIGKTQLYSIFKNKRIITTAVIPNCIQTEEGILKLTMLYMIGFVPMI